jgi:hypothetical protein
MRPGTGRIPVNKGTLDPRFTYPMRSRGKSFSYYMMPSAFWSGIMAVLLVVPSSGYPSVSLSGTDLIIHAGLFGIWGFLTVQGFYKQAYWPVLRFYRGFAVLIIGVLWAVALEAVQGFLLWERSAGLEDYVADIVGVLLGMLVFERLVRLSRRRQ